MDKYFGIRRADVFLTDKSVYTFREPTKAPPNNLDLCDKGTGVLSHYEKCDKRTEVLPHCDKGTGVLSHYFDEVYGEGELANRFGRFLMDDDEGFERGKLGDIVYSENKYAKSLAQRSGRDFYLGNNTQYIEESKADINEYEPLYRIRERDYPASSSVYGQKIERNPIGHFGKKPNEHIGKKPIEQSGKIPSEHSSKNTVAYSDKKTVEHTGNKPVVYSRKTRQGGYFKGLLIRVSVAAVLFLGVLGMSKIDSPFFQRATETIKNAITYDLDKNEDKQLGEIEVVSKLEELQDKQNDE